MHLNFEPNLPASENISFNQYLDVDMRIGEVTEVREFPEARNPSYILIINFGEGIGLKKTSAQITHHYSKKSLIGKKVLAVVNFEPKQIGPILSEVLVMGFSDNENNIVLFNLDKNVPNGARLH
jgi:tRNA-binding protein